MPIYHRLGELPPKRHTQFRKADGTLYHEQLFGVRGFSGPHSLLYHNVPPTEISKVEVLSEDVNPKYIPHSAGMRHRHFRLGEMKPSGDPISGRKASVGNDDVVIYVCVPEKPMDYFFSNGNRDEIVFVHEGTGELHSQFGQLKYRPGDYIVIPKGTIYQLHPDFSKPTRYLIIETPDNVSLPKHYFNEVGQLLEHSPFCARDFRLPEKLETRSERGDFLVKVKTWHALMGYHWAHHPFDVAGWDGYLYPWIFNIEDFEPVTGRIHQPPPVHLTFALQNFVVCSFVPRMFDYHPQAIAVPYNHSNLQSDEVLYYVNGDFMSRRGISKGSITLHPGGIPHGPQPGAVEASLGATKTDEMAVMVDTFRPLKVAMDADKFDDANYPFSWMTK